MLARFSLTAIAGKCFGLKLIAAVLLSFLVGGSVKGAFGIGFPAVVMSILPLFIEPSLAIALLVWAM